MSLGIFAEKIVLPPWSKVLIGTLLKLVVLKPDSSQFTKKLMMLYPATLIIFATKVLINYVINMAVLQIANFQ